MFKGLKNLFVYKKPPEDRDGFELLEGYDESALWNQYRGKEQNLQNSNQGQQNNKNQSADQNQQKGAQDDVSKKLMEILQNSSRSQQNQNDGMGNTSGTSDADVGSRLIQIMKNGSNGDGQNPSAAEQANASEQNKENGEGDKKAQNSKNGNDKTDHKSDESNQSGQSVMSSPKPGDNGGKHKRRQNDKSGKVITPLAIQEILKNSNTSKEEKTGDPIQNEDNSEKSDNDGNAQDAKKIGGEDSGKSGLESKLSAVVKNYEIKEKASEFKNQNQEENSEKENKNLADAGAQKERKQEEQDNKENNDVNDKNTGANAKESGKENEEDQEKRQDECGQNQQGAPECITGSLKQDKKYLEQIFHLPKNQDIIIREFNIAREIPAFLVFVDGMIDKHVVIQFTLPQLMDVHPFSHYDGGCPLDYIEKNVITINQIVRMKKFTEIVQQILSGLTAVFVDGCDEVLILESRGYEKRSIQAPVTETVVQGAQEGFTENLRTNITLVRRIVKNENLITEFSPVSKTNNLQCALLYMEGLTNPKILDEVKRRIKKLDIDYISGSGMLHQLIEDKPSMLFPQLISTERPDRVASFLMEGKAVLICEGTPFALAMPITFFDLFHTSEESNLRWQYGSFITLVRVIGLLLATFFPGMYTALILFHQEMIPTSLLASIVVSRGPVPFPTIVEVLLMEFAFELIREGGIRVPGVIGNTLGIIGALILGQAAVEAGLVSPILIIVVAVSGLGSFAIPNNSLSLAVRIMRFLLIFFGYIAGFYGVSAAFTILCALALNMKSFGVPYFAPIAPVTRSNEDKIIRGPIYRHTYRPDFVNPLNRKRMADNPRVWAAEDKGGNTGNAQGR